MRNKKKPEMGLQAECRKCSVKRSRNYKINNYERQIKNERRWYAENRESELQKRKERRKLNKEKEDDYCKNYRKLRKDKVKIYNGRRAKKNHNISKSEWKSNKEYFGNSCAYCGMTEQEHRELFNQDLHKEHVDSNGANDISNCVPACKICNSEKHTDTLDEWYNMNNIRFHPDRYFKIKQWLKVDYKKFIKQ